MADFNINIAALHLSYVISARSPDRTTPYSERHERFFREHPENFTKNRCMKLKLIIVFTTNSAPPATSQLLFSDI